MEQQSEQQIEQKKSGCPPHLEKYKFQKGSKKASEAGKKSRRGKSRKNAFKDTMKEILESQNVLNLVSTYVESIQNDESKEVERNEFAKMMINSHNRMTEHRDKIDYQIEQQEIKAAVTAYMRNCNQDELRAIIHGDEDED